MQLLLNVVNKSGFLQDNNKVDENLENDIANASLGDGGEDDEDEHERDCGNAWGESGEHTVEMCGFWMEGVLVTVTGQ